MFYFKKKEMLFFDHFYGNFHGLSTNFKEPSKRRTGITHVRDYPNDSKGFT